MTAQAWLVQRSPGEGRRTRTRADHDVFDAGPSQGSEQQPRPFGQQRRCHAETPSAPKSAASFQRVSANSLGALESDTTPAPAYSSACFPATTPQRKATTSVVTDAS